jgi:hypothetical protein
MLGTLKLLRLLDSIEDDPIFVFILGSYFEDFPKLSTSKFLDFVEITLEPTRSFFHVYIREAAGIDQAWPWQTTPCSIIIGI